MPDPAGDGKKQAATFSEEKVAPKDFFYARAGNFARPRPRLIKSFWSAKRAPPVRARWTSGLFFRKRTFFLFLLFLPSPALAASHYFTASDGAVLHYTQSGPPGAPVLVFIPGWTMPGWIFAPQLRAFSRSCQVVEFDPRGQGRSEITAGGYNQDRRGADIGDLLARFPGKVVVIGWSLGVLDTLAYIHQSGAQKLAGLVLIDNSVGENPPPVPSPYRPGPVLSHSAYMRAFVAGMFRTRQSPAYLNRLTLACLRLPPRDAQALLAYPVPRSYWKSALLSTDIPVLYAVRPHLEAQAGNLAADRPNTTIAFFPHAGHALFVDDAGRFNALLANFLTGEVWPQEARRD